MKSIVGDGKWADMKGLFEKGIETYSFLFLTSLYLQNKEAFLDGSQFFSAI